MKLIYCDVCGHLFSLSMEARMCDCGRAGGYYLDDGLNAVVWAGIPVGISNDSFHLALDSRRNEGLGTNFTAFIIPRKTSTVFEDPTSRPQDPDYFWLNPNNKSVSFAEPVRADLLKRAKALSLDSGHYPIETVSAEPKNPDFPDYAVTDDV